MRGIWRGTALLAVLGLIGCQPHAPSEAPLSSNGGSSPSTSASSSTTSAGPSSPAGSATPSAGPRFALCPKALNNPYFNIVRDGARSAAARLKIPEPQWVGSTEADAGKQVAVLNDVVSSGIAGIGIAPNAPESISGVVQRAQAHKIPVICFDADAPKSGRRLYVGTDNHAGGLKAGQAMARLLNGKGDVLVVTGGLGALNLNERIRGFREGIAGTGLRVAAVQACDDDQARAHQIIQDYLLSHPNTAGIFGAGLWAVLPAGQILTQKHLAGKVKVVGFDTLAEELALVKDGSVQVLVGQRPFDMGRIAIEQLYALSKGGKAVRSVIDTGTDVVTSKNVDQFLKAARPA